MLNGVLRIVVPCLALFTLGPITVSSDDDGPCVGWLEGEAGGWQWSAGEGTTLRTVGGLTVHNPAPRRLQHERDVQILVEKYRGDLTVEIHWLPHAVRISDVPVRIVANDGTQPAIVCGDDVVACPLDADQAILVDVMYGGESVAQSASGGAILTRSPSQWSRTDPHYDVRLVLDDDGAIVAALREEAGPVELEVLVTDAGHQEEHRLFSITFEIKGYAELQLLADAASRVVAASRERKDCRGIDL